MFALVDANAFYCSAEAVFRPDWRHKPIIVLSNNDGCIVAANRLAKEAGIKKFIPYFQAKRLCEQKGVIVCSSNYELYADLSAKMMQIIGRFAPEQHIYSIDETFLSFHRSAMTIPDLQAHGLLIRKAVWKETRLPVCVGIAPTLTLTKLANHQAKRNKQSQGVCVLDSDSAIHAALKATPVEDVWGIGRKISSKLKLMGIETAYDLARMPPKLARKQFSIEIERTVRELNGQACKQWDEARADKKQIFSTRSMGNRITCQHQLQQALCKHVGIAAAKARKQQSGCTQVLVFAANSPHDDNPKQFKRIVRFARPTNCTLEISKAVSLAIPELFADGVRYYRVGVGMLDLTDMRHQQFDLFTPQKSKPELMHTIDKLNHRYGSDTVFVSAQGTQVKWSMRRDLLTPQYTTDWRSVPVIRC
ncbi:Y-family DNA polymerase [Shewanella sp. 202IG2-18]|uniref:Y-family DNA polymerase n=1 Tax=Parashewanella hymeniacidonis TaxID=2807618 RepID=UPI001961D6ED|nr:Y-family DNA polymerase [Parashewanella hymeniacidonis]MBM7072424.1 Y-family DNA polymerase [Parashewanella hymeniacidonis]